MEELSIEEKAKRYDEAIEKLRSLHNDYDTVSTLIDVKEELENIFPELKESEDERIKQLLLRFVKYDMSDNYSDDFTPADCVAWLEKQGDLKREVNYPKFDFNDILALQCCMETVKKVQEDKELYEKLNDLHSRVYDAYQLEKQGEQKDVNEDAEKEKYDYVSGQFLYCKGSFNEFKEGESYWLEYIGNDTYVGRSDNILNQKFHITPRQLYTWLDPRHPEDSNKCEQKPDDNKGMNIDEDSMTPFQKKVFCIIDTAIEEEQGLKQVCDELLSLAHDEIMWNPAWSEEDEDVINHLLAICAEAKRYIHLAGCPQDDVVKYQTWLKSLKDRVQPQPKQEWSKEDEDILNTIINHFKIDIECTDEDDVIRWLKSLRPQSTWKPSDNELEVLRLAAEKDGACLMGLYEQLKKLK